LFIGEDAKMGSVKNWIAGAVLAVVAGVYGYSQSATLLSAGTYAAVVAGLVSFLLLGAESISSYLNKQSALYIELVGNHAVHMLRDEVVRPLVILSILSSKEVRDMKVEDIADAEKKAEVILRSLKPKK